MSRAANLIMGIVYAVMAVAFAWHYAATAQEDTSTVWVCSVMGNHECGPDAAPIDIRF